MDNAVVEYLKRKNVEVIDENIEEKLEVWEQWYKGKVDNFHTYKVYQGKKKLKKERKTLMMPLRACQRWADLLLNEKVEINTQNEALIPIIEKLLKQANFYVRGNNLIERAFALGAGFFIEYWDGTKTNIKYVSQEQMYPITYDSGRLIEAAFASKKVIDGKTYTYLETHLLDDNGDYVIDNSLLSTDGKGLNEVSEEFYAEHNILAKWETHRKEPLFQMIRPNIANRDNFNSPYGTSVFSGAIDKVKTIDLIFDSYYKEFELGKKRIFVTDGVTNINYDENGNTVQVFDPKDEVFYRLPDDEKTAPITESNPALRIAEHKAGLETMLTLFSQDVGFGVNGFKWDSGNVSTATQIISENSEMFRTLKKHEAILEDAIVSMVKGLLFVESMYTGAKLNYEEDITVNFDDSIIEDTAEKKRQAILELNSGLIDAIQYYIDVYKMTEEQAIAFREKMQARNPQIEEEPTGA